MTATTLHYTLTSIHNKFNSGRYFLPRKGAKYHYLCEDILTRVEKAIATTRLYTPYKNGVTKMPSELTFVTVTLSDDLEDQFDALYEAREIDLGEAIQELLEAGMNISLKRSSDGDSWQCTLIGSDRAGKNTGYGMGAWSNDPIESILYASFKFIMVAEFDLSKYNKTKQRRKRS